MTIIDIEEVEALQERRAQINAIPLDQIVWHRNGKPIEVSRELVYEWQFTGLGNVPFVEIALRAEAQP